MIDTTTRWCRDCLISAREAECFVCGKPMTPTANADLYRLAFRRPQQVVPLPPPVPESSEE